jgi:hypothetical protein
MENIQLVYIALALIFVAVLTYMVVYNTHLKTRQRTMALKGRPPVCKEEGIAVATLEKEHAHRSGTIS